MKHFSQFKGHPNYADDNVKNTEKNDEKLYIVFFQAEAVDVDNRCVINDTSRYKDTEKDNGGNSYVQCLCVVLFRSNDCVNWSSIES